MKFFLQKHHRIVFYCTWLLLAIVQSASTELIEDEAYYWVYSRFPAWGYFDHPPMVAILIKCGYAIFQNELGVRLAFALLSVYTIVITESLTDRKNPFLFYTIALSIGTFQIAGFLAVPDTPLLFSTALFLYCYRYFLKKINWQGALLLGISIALLFYSKYHGLLVVFFVFLSNLKLLLRWQTWLAGVFAIVLFAPHLLWEWENNWVSFRYHLFENNIRDYRLYFSIDYLLGQLFVAGPFAGLFLIPAALLYKANSDFEKALKFTLLGIYAFFFLSSFRGNVEANWTFPVLIPLLVLSYQFINLKPSWIKPFRKVALVSFILILFGRIYLIEDIGPNNAIKEKFQHHKEWAKAIAGKTANSPVVFLNSYQNASLYWFYSGYPAHSLNGWGARRSNYNYWPTENRLLGHSVFISGGFASKQQDSVKTKKGWVYISPDSKYSSMGEIKIIPDKNKIEIEANKNFSLKCGVVIPETYVRFLKQYPDLKTELLAGVFKGNNLVKEIYTGISAQGLIKMEEIIVQINTENIPSGKYSLRLGIRSNGYAPTHNSDKIKLVVR